MQRGGLQRLGLTLALWAGVATAQPGIEGTLGQSSTIIEKLGQHGITLDISIIGDHSTVLEGGRNPRSSADRVLAQAGLIIDTDKAVGLPGGTFAINYLGFHGDDGSLDTGDTQVYSNIDGPSFDALYSLWYEQDLIDETAGDQVRQDGCELGFRLRGQWHGLHQLIARLFADDRGLSFISEPLDRDQYLLA